MGKNYLKYDAIDFAEDTSFIKGVQGEDQKAIAFWKDWEATHPEKKEAIKEAKVLVKSIQIEEEEPSKERIQNLWNKIDVATSKEAKIEIPAAVIRPMNRRRWIGYAAAASIAILIGFFALSDSDTVINVSNGQHLTHVLPDNSKIELNAGSIITFKEGTYNKNRTIRLQGEAFFEVEKGATFKVITPNGTVEVLGTSFNVNSRNGRLEVDCRTGKVKVTATVDNNNAKILTKGQGTKLNTQKSALETVTSIDIDKKIGWRNGNYYFTNVPFDKVLKELERQYDVSIDCEQDLKNKIGDYVFSGNLEEALNKVKFQLNAEPTIDSKNKKVIFRKN